MVHRTALALILLSAACSRTDEVEVAPLDVPAPAPDDLGARGAALLDAVVKANTEAGAEARRLACIESRDAIRTEIASAPEKGARAEAASRLKMACAELLATDKTLRELADALPQLPLSAAFAASFTADILKGSFKKVKARTRAKKDPTQACASLRVMAEHLIKSNVKKTRALATTSLAYCSGPGARAAVRVHLGEAELALGADKSDMFAEHCARAVVALDTSTPSKHTAKLREKTAVLCLEAIALKPTMLAQR